MKSEDVDCRRLETGELVEAGDIMLYGPGHTFRIAVKSCKYDPGCCVGHRVEPYDVFLREREKRA